MSQIYEWREWFSRSRKKFIAYAVDPASQEKTGRLRAVNGSVVPEYAQLARAETPRDERCLEIIEQRAKHAPA